MLFLIFCNTYVQYYFLQYSSLLKATSHRINILLCKANIPISPIRITHYIIIETSTFGNVDEHEYKDVILRKCKNEHFLWQ